MINIDMLNTLIEFGALTLALGILLFGFFILDKTLNYKEYKNLEERKTAKLQELYVLHKQLLRVKNSTRKDKILIKIDNIEKDIALIDRINWGLDYEEEDSK